VSGSPRRWPLLLLISSAFLSATPTRAESAFELPYPLHFGPVPAATYDSHGERIGDATVSIEQVEGGVRLVSRSGKWSGESTIATATFVPVEPGKTMRLVRQESRSFDGEGELMGVLLIDHVARRATCRMPDGEVVGEIPLPSPDRVVNVPMNLFFLPLVRGERKTLAFQLFLCRDGARAIDFEAWVEHGRRWGFSRPKLIEVRYGPDFGPVVSIIARGFVPRLSFWFDRKPPHQWAGHRMPLYSGGPEVLVIRDGVPPDWLED
jgi:hypothetical protein